MSLSDPKKQGLYLPGPLLAEIKAEARRQDRSLSWIIRMAWRAARDRIAQFPGAP